MMSVENSQNFLQKIAEIVKFNLKSGNVWQKILTFVLLASMVALLCMQCTVVKKSSNVEIKQDAKTSVLDSASLNLLNGSRSE